MLEAQLSHRAHGEHGENYYEISVNSVFSVVTKFVAYPFRHSQKSSKKIPLGVQWYNFFPYAPRPLNTKISDLPYLRNKTK
jgi:hypothetical protein